MNFSISALVVLAVVSTTSLIACSKYKKRAESAPAVAALSAPAYSLAQTPGSAENYQHLPPNSVKSTATAPVSTFSIDVDTGAYANVRRFLNKGQLPPKDAVRLEELINYFPYSNAVKSPDHPFAIQTEVAPAPWNLQHQLVRIRVQAAELSASTLPACNLVFLVDVSGSMADANKLPLVKSSLKMLVTRLRAEDRVSLVVYAGRTEVVLQPTPGNQTQIILAAINKLTAEGATAGESAIKLAYQQARSSFIPGGINRILMATDGDFNVGLTDINQLKELVAAERKQGISLTTLGFGEGNYNDYLMEQLADIGNGNYAYVDSAAESRKVLIQEMASTFNTVASDVKIQVEFNPARVAEYRLLGYENRMLQESDFNNDSVDAGEIGAGKTVTALYEITPTGQPRMIDPHRYGQTPLVDKPQQEKLKTTAHELAFLRVRYKQPHAQVSTLLESPILISASQSSLEQASPDFRFAASVAAFSQALQKGDYLNGYSFEQMVALAKSGLGTDDEGYRAEFVRLIEVAKDLTQAGADKNQ